MKNIIDLNIEKIRLTNEEKYLQEDINKVFYRIEQKELISSIMSLISFPIYFFCFFNMLSYSISGKLSLGVHDLLNFQFLTCVPLFYKFDKFIKGKKSGIYMETIDIKEVFNKNEDVEILNDKIIKHINVENKLSMVCIEIEKSEINFEETKETIEKEQEILILIKEREKLKTMLESYGHCKFKENIKKKNKKI